MSNEHPTIEEINQSYNFLWKRQHQIQDAMQAIQSMRRLVSWIQYHPQRGEELCKDLNVLIQRYIHTHREEKNTNHEHLDQGKE